MTLDNAGRVAATALLPGTIGLVKYLEKDL